MYRYDGFDHAFVRERVVQFRDQVDRRLAGQLTEDEFRPLRLRNGLYLQLHAYMTIPVAALTGDNVVYRSTAMPWYAGPTLLDYLEAVDPVAELVDAPFRLPVQLVLRAAGDFRGYAGSVTSGRIKVGDRIVDARSGLGATLRRIASMSGCVKKRPPHP